MKIYNAGNIVMNTYVYQSTVGYIMIDTGYEHSLKDVEKKLVHNNINLSEIKYLFLTHAHDDHAGFLNELLSKNKKLKVILSDKAVPTLKKGQNSFNGGCSTRLAWLFCKFMELLGNGEHCFPIIEDKYDNRLIVINDDNKEEIEKILNGKILYTPGHTLDSISLKINDIVFCGDAAMNGFPSIKRFIIWIENTKQFEESWDLMINEGIKIIYPAHGKPFQIKDLIKNKKDIHKINLLKLR